MATQQEMITAMNALKEQLADERALTEQTSSEWKAALATAQEELAAFQKAAQQAAEDQARYQEWAKGEIVKARAACPPAEAGCSINVAFTINDEGTTVTGGQLTLRANEYEQALDVLGCLARLMMERKWKVASAPKPVPPAPVKGNKAFSILKEAGATPEVLAAAQQATAHINPVTEVKAVHISVEPKPGGKTSVNFFGNDRKQPHNQFADVYVTRSAEQLGQLMPFIDPTVFEQAGEYAAVLTVGYTLSDKLNTKGNPYKDVQYVRQA